MTKRNYQDYLRYLQNRRNPNFVVTTTTEWSGSGDFTGAVVYNMDEVAKEQIQDIIIPHNREILPEMFQEFVEQQIGQFSLFQEKHRFYGLKNIFGENEDYEDQENINEALQGLYFRMRDKLTRFKELIGKENTTDESMQDTLDDLANYAQICQIVSKKKWGK